MARRLFLFFLGITLLAVGVGWLADRPGRVVIDWQDYRIDTSVAAIVLALVLAFILALIVIRFIRWILFGRARTVEWRLRRQQQKGDKAVARGLTALAAGDAAGAQRHAEKAQRVLKNSPFLPLLQAQAARLAGDSRKAARFYQKLASQPETDLLGLRGLMYQAMEAGDRAAALKLASRVISLRPRTGWAINALFDLSVEGGDWKTAAKAIDNAVKASVLSAAEAKRRRAILLLLETRERARDGDLKGATRLALDGHRICPDLSPLTALAAEGLIQEGKDKKAKSLIGEAWAAAPHPRLAELYRQTVADQPPATQVQEVESLIAKAPDHEESRIALAEAALKAQFWGMAREALEPLISQPSRRVARLMAAVAEGEGDAGEERRWLDAALAAGPDPRWRCRLCGWESPEWEAVCGGCRRFDTIRWEAPMAAIGGPDGPSSWRRLSEPGLIG